MMLWLLLLFDGVVLMWDDVDYDDLDVVYDDVMVCDVL